MKKLTAAIIALLLTAFVFTGCKGTAGGSDEATLKVVIEGINARTVFPDVKTSDLTDIKLTYRKTTEESNTVKTWNTANEIAALSIGIGTYNFALEAKCKGFNYSASVENFSIVSGENTITFNLDFSEYVPEDMEGQGTITHTYTVPSNENIRKVKAGLFKYNDDDELETAYEAEEVTVTDNEDGTYTAAFTKTVDSAEYVLKYFFYADDDATMLVDTYSVVVYVLKGITSKADESTDHLCTVYSIIYDLNGGAWTEGYDAPVQFTYSSVLELPDSDNVTKTGYHLVKWVYINSSSTEAIESVTAVASDIKVYAIWEANTDTPYTVKHWQQNIDDDEYILIEDDTQTLKGTTAEDTGAEAKDYTGFDAISFNQKEIAGDGSTVVNIYYDRKIIYITLILGSSTTTTKLDEQNRVSGRYGAPVEIARPALSGSNFSGWINENNETESLPVVFTEDRTFIANFISGNGAGIALDVNGIQDITVTAAYSESSDAIVFTAEEGFSSYKWTVNGVKQGSNAETLNITLNGSAIYNVTLTAKKNGVRYSSDVVLNLAEEKDKAPAVGKILMSDGSYIDAVKYSSYTGTATPIGIVCKVNEDGTSGLMLGLRNSWNGTTSVYEPSTGYKQWVRDGSTSYYTNFTEIHGTDSNGDTDGSDNWEEICKVDTEETADPATNYPAFNYALTYAATAGLEGTEYEEGWYMPTVYELWNYVCRNKDLLNASLTAAGGTTLASGRYWSSSQYNNNDKDNELVWLVDLNFDNPSYNTKTCYCYVCCLKAF